MRQQIDRDTKLTLDGHAFAGNENYKVEMTLSRRDVGFVQQRHPALLKEPVSTH